jgi:protein gp37
MLRWPLPHVWLGVTVENQAAADERIPLLLQTPAAVRWISVEPMIGPISFVGMFANPNNPWDGTNVLEEIDWVVCGGESGKNARPMHSDWARQLRDCCAAVDVPFMFKQWGEWVPLRPSMDGCAYLDGPALVQEHSPKRRPKIWPGYSIGGDFPPWMQAMRVGKKAAGRLIDGVLHDEYPQQKKERSHER